MINEGISILGLSEVKSNWSKIAIKYNIYNSTDGWLKTRRISTGYNRVTTYKRRFQNGAIDIMAVAETSCKAIARGQYFWNLGWCSWMLLQGRNNIVTIIVDAYCPTVSASAGVAYSQQLEDLTIMKIRNNSRNQLWIDLNTKIVK